MCHLQEETRLLKYAAKGSRNVQSLQEAKDRATNGPTQVQATEGTDAPMLPL